MTRIIEGNLYRISYEGKRTEYVECNGEKNLFVYAASQIRNGYMITSVNEILKDGRTPKVRLRTDRTFKKILAFLFEMLKDTKCEVVEQECCACGKTFQAMYSEDGMIRLLGDECACEAPYIPIGPYISEWLEEVN